MNTFYSTALIHIQPIRVYPRGFVIIILLIRISYYSNDEFISPARPNEPGRPSTLAHRKKSALFFIKRRKIVETRRISVE